MKHAHTTHALRDVIEALPRYEEFRDGVEEWEHGEYVKFADVIALVRKASTLGAPIEHLHDEEGA